MADQAGVLGAWRAERLLIDEDKTKEKTGKNEKMGGIDNAVWRSKSSKQWHGSLTCPLLTSGDIIVDFGKWHL